MKQTKTLHHHRPISKIKLEGKAFPAYFQRRRIMPLLLTGNKFCQDLEGAGCIALHAPLEGGSETRLLRRMRAKGYQTQISSARGLGDPEVFLFESHGIRPPHLGHQNVGRNGALGEVQQVKPQLGELFDGDKPVLLWLIEGAVLSRSELLSIVNLCSREKRLKVVVEMGGSRSLRWEPMNEYLTNRSTSQEN